MKIKKIIFSAMLSTSAMTLYSYLQSGDKRRDFREPKLLHGLIERSPKVESVPRATGWILHYAVGFGFAPAYFLLWGKFIQPNVNTGAIMGAVNGAIGIGIWATALRIHPSPPPIDRNAFYRHLLIAHMVYGTSMAIGYKSNQ